MKRFKFELGGMYVYYFGENLGRAIAEFVKHRPNYVDMIESITEEPVTAGERP